MQAEYRQTRHYAAQTVLNPPLRVLHLHKPEGIICVYIRPDRVIHSRLPDRLF